jgi:Holliday junction DNA helicase RuvA
MIAKLTGVVDSVGVDHAVIDVAGVGYLVQCSRRTLAVLPKIGASASILIETHVREDHIQLYGFLEREERDWFRLLLTVQGVGSKAALAILSVLAPDELVAAIAAGDRAALSRASGVGAKLAGRIAAELEEKVGGPAIGAPGARPGGGEGTAPGAAEPVTAAVSALVNLGYGQTESYGAVARAARRLGSDGGLDALIRSSLQELGA